MGEDDETAAVEAVGARAAGRSELEELAAGEEGVEEEAGPTETLDPSTEIVKVWPVELAAELAGEIVTVEEAGGVEGALAPPDEDAGATTAPRGTSAAEPSMTIVTTTASQTALLWAGTGWALTLPQGCRYSHSLGGSGRCVDRRQVR